MIAYLSLSLAIIAATEYLVHRYPMHRPTVGALRYTLHQHAVLHHRDRRNDLDIDVGLRWVLLLASPVVLAAVLAGYPGFGAVYLAAILSYAAFWTHLHRSFHGVGSDFMRVMPVWPLLHRHHMRHHRNPTKNFGGAFGPLVDIIAGTRDTDGHARRQPD